MFGRSILAAALLLPSIIAARPNDVNTPAAAIASLKEKGWIADGKLEIPMATFCNPWITRLTMGNRLCTTFTSLVQDVHVAETALFCSNIKCNAKYEPSTGLCLCAWGSAQQMDEDRMWPRKNCDKSTKCYAPNAPHWNPSTESCTCAIETFPQPGSLVVRFKPDPVKERLYGPTNQEVQLSTTEDVLQHMGKEIKQLASAYNEAMLHFVHQHGFHPRTQPLQILASLHAMLTHLTTNAVRRSRRSVSMTQETPGAVSLAPLPTYIPPPDTVVTQELIQESLQIQPQQAATVGSVVPHFADGIITFLVQLDGPVSQTLALNATDTLPCGTIGAHDQPNLILVPKSVKNGTGETVLPDCLVIAVNMYNPKYITYWVQKEDGSVFSLLSDNKIHAINQLDTSQPAAIAIRVDHTDSAKRDIGNLNPDVQIGTLERRQVFSIACENPCPFHHMQRIQGSDGYCGCIFMNADQNVNVAARGVEAPSPYTAIMTAKACAAMACVNNGGKPALFNPFTATCWCSFPTYVQESGDAYTGM